MAEIIQVQIGQAWYAVVERAPDWYQAEVWGVWASGRTPEEAVANALARHVPDESEGGEP